MKLIDADLIQYEPMLSAKGNGVYEDVEVAYRTQIDAIPAADVIEVRHGHWEHTPTYWIYCSVCGNEPNEYNERTNFCPYCGADMRGET